METQEHRIIQDNHAVDSCILWGEYYEKKVRCINEKMDCNLEKPAQSSSKRQILAPFPTIHLRLEESLFYPWITDFQGFYPNFYDLFYNPSHSR